MFLSDTNGNHLAPSAIGFACTVRQFTSETSLCAIKPPCLQDKQAGKNAAN